MKRHRVSIAKLMGGVALAALAFAALREPLSALWASVSFAMTALVLGAATLGAFHRRGSTWVGFAAFGWAYLLWAFGPWHLSTPIPATPGRLMVDEAFARLFAGLGPASGRRVGGRIVLDRSYFAQTGESLATLLVACLGAVTGRLVAGPRGRARSEASEGSP